jgi:type II secretory ATPase GspE/PulE/Tfp pilus assembly ATPase PilB-like protein
VISEKLRHLISMGASILEIMELAAEEGTSSLIQDARIRIDKGLTTVEEVLRVLGTQVIM